MKSINTILLIVTVSTAMLLSGCFSEKMPEVNDINCKTENILQIKDKTMQQEFASKCLRRGEFKPSEPRIW